MKKLGSYKGVIVILVLAALIIMYFYHLSNISRGEEEDEAAASQNAVTQVLQRNLDTDYPQTPKEVVKYFSEITKCYYNEKLTDEEIEALATQMLGLYDDELVAANSYNVYIFDLKSDITYYNTNGYTISSYSPSASTDVEYFTQDGHQWARLWCVYTIKSGKNYKPLQEVFILRKDDRSHWRIYGWKEVKKEE